jgi:DNA-binding MarR family transcriptional regulator
MRQGSLRARPDVEEGTELWPNGFSGWIRVGIVYARTTRHIATMMRPLDLTVAQFDALAHLYVEDGISQQELAERLLVSKGNVTGLINRLADRGLVERHADPDDRRTKRLKITRSGRALAKKALRKQAQLVEAMMTRLTDRERDTLSRLLGQLAAHFD